jgi:clan AA aspartic protease
MPRFVSHETEIVQQYKEFRKDTKHYNKTAIGTVPMAVLLFLAIPIFGKIYFMGLVYSQITLSNPVKSELLPMETKCLVDTGITYLVLPQHIATQLQLVTLETREATTADGSSQTVPYAGPINVSFENRSCFVGAIIMGDEVLLGAVSMEDMDLIVQPKLLKLSVNPESPNIPRGSEK